MFKNKRADESLVEEVIFIVLNLVFFIMLIIFVLRSSSETSVYEEIYAKKIALAMDMAQPASSITLNAVDLYQKSRATKFEPIITIKNNIVNVKLAKSSSGYDYRFFTNFETIITLNNKSYEKEEIIIKIGDKK